MRTAAVTLLAACMLAAGCSGGTQAVQWQPTPQVLTVAQVAAEMHATRVADCTSTGAGSLVGVADAGTAYLGSERIGINVFRTAAARDAWRQMAASFVTVIAVGGTWAAYRSLNQAGTGCD